MGFAVHLVIRFVVAMQLTAAAVDGGPGALPVFTRLTVRVVDVNDNPPEIVVNALTGSHVAEVHCFAYIG